MGVLVFAGLSLYGDVSELLEKLQAVLIGLGMNLSLFATTFTYSAATVAGAVAMMPGGLGVTEAGMTGILISFGAVGMTPAVATVATILARLATLWWAVAIGFGSLLVFRKGLRHRRVAASRLTPSRSQEG